MHHIIICKNDDSTIFMHVSDCSKTWKMWRSFRKGSKMLKFVLETIKL